MNIADSQELIREFVEKHADVSSRDCPEVDALNDIAQRIIELEDFAELVAAGNTEFDRLEILAKELLA